MLINRPSDDLKAKMDEQSLSDLKIGFKIFINNDNKAVIQEAIDEGVVLFIKNQANVVKL